MSQAQLAERLPMAVRTLQAWERGRGTPPSFIERALNDLARELSLGTRGGKADMVIMDDVRHVRPSPYHDDRHPLADFPLANEADVADDDEPTHELAYVEGDQVP